MRIALTITELDPGGAETCLVNLACFLAERQHTVQVLALGPPPADGRDHLTRQLDAHGIAWQCGGRTRPWQFLSAANWLRKQLRAFKPQVVQSMLFHANVLSSLALPPSANTFLGGARVRQPERIRWTLQRLSTRKMAKLVCVSRDVAEHCQHNERIPTEKLAVIPNGIQAVPAVSPPACWTDLGLPPNARVLLSVGRLAEQKGYASLIENADAILGQAPDLHLVILGDGPLREPLEKLRQTQTSHSRIHLAGWQADAIRWMQACELFVLPTRYEGMPNVVLEAMSASRPVVAFGVEGVAEVFGSAPTARPQVVPAGNMPAFVAQTINMLHAPQTQQDCGAANRRRVADAFDLSTQLAKYEQLYLDLS